MDADFGMQLAYFVGPGWQAGSVLSERAPRKGRAFALSKKGGSGLDLVRALSELR